MIGLRRSDVVKAISIGLTMVVAFALALFIGACQRVDERALSEESQGTAGGINEQASGDSAITPICIRNGTDRGGFATLVGEKLIDTGYRYENGYTIDIGNSLTSESPESMIWVSGSSERLYRQASELQSLLGFKLVNTSDREKPNERFSDEGILIVLGLDKVSSSAFDVYAQSGRSYPPIPGYDKTTVFQMEPFDEAAAVRIEEQYDTTKKESIPEEAVHLKVYNSSAVDGAATTAAERLTRQGFSPTASQTAQAPHDGTWIVYQSADFEAEARAVGNLMGNVESYFCITDYPGWGYVTADIAVFVGLDWVNENMLKEGQAPYPPLATTPLTWS
ncbi:MAG TPA: hypothetical protein DEB24_00150 [Coriobacteriia bacterium]|nr:hypothetical protein [Coriobacteriia bacterium]